MRLGDVLRWPADMANEVLALPELLHDARELTRELAQVTTSLTDVSERLTELLAPLEHLDIAGAFERLLQLSDDLERRFDDVVRPLDLALGQVASIERSTTEIRNATFAVLRRVPGARKAVLDAVPAAADEIDQADSGPLPVDDG